MKKAVAIRHVTFEDLGVFAAPIEKAGYRIKYCDVGLDPLNAEEIGKADLLAVLGGPIGAYESADYPFLAQEIDILRGRLAAGKPTIGFCLGAQLMALALGAKVAPGPAKEIGWAPVKLTNEGEEGLLHALKDVTVLHWHGDRFDLPKGAVNLASTDLCPHQAFSVGSYALAFQFHPEADGRKIERWLIGHACEIAGVKRLSVKTLRADTKRFGEAAATAGRECIATWLRGFAE